MLALPFHSETLFQKSVPVKHFWGGELQNDQKTNEKLNFNRFYNKFAFCPFFLSAAILFKQPTLWKWQMEVGSEHLIYKSTRNKSEKTSRSIFFKVWYAHTKYVLNCIWVCRVWTIFGTSIKPWCWWYQISLNYFFSNFRKKQIVGQMEYSYSKKNLFWAFC